MTKPSKFYDLFQDRVKKNRSKLLFQKRDGWSWKQITWLDFNTEIKSIASFLLDSGFQKGTKVLIVAPNTLERLFVESAVLLLGGCIVSMPYNAQENVVAQILGKEKIRFVFLNNSETLFSLKLTLESNKTIEKIFLLSDDKVNIKNGILNYRSIIKFGFLKSKKLQDTLTDLFASVRPDMPALNLYVLNGNEVKNKNFTQELILKLLHLSHERLRFITSQDQAFSYLDSSDIFSHFANFLPFFTENRMAIAGNKKDFFSDILEVMPTVLFLSNEHVQLLLNNFNAENTSSSPKNLFGGRLKYVFTSQEQGHSIKSIFIKENISVIDLPELGHISL